MRANWLCYKLLKVVMKINVQKEKEGKTTDEENIGLQKENDNIIKIE